MFDDGLALKNDGTLVTWGNSNNYLVSHAPPGSHFSAISGSLGAALAHRIDGTFTLWGQAGWAVVDNAPTGRIFQSATLGMYHGVGLDPSGQIYSWGSDFDGQVSNTPIGVGFLKAVATPYGGIALDANGAIHAWGWDEYGQVSDAPSKQGFVDIAGGNQAHHALKPDGTIVSWGNSNFGQTQSPVGESYTKLAAGSWHAIAMFETPASSNHPPVANDDDLWGQRGHVADFDVLENDSDPDGDFLFIAHVSGANHGTLSTNGEWVTYQPDNNFEGFDSFQYTIEDPSGASASATVSVTISENHAPAAITDTAETWIDTPVIVSVVDNDTDAEGNLDPTTVTIGQQPSHGFVINLGDGRVSYTPTNSNVQNDTFTYQVADTVGAWSNNANVNISFDSGSNNIPTARNDFGIVGDDADTVEINVLANDFDPDGDALDLASVVIESQGGKGHATRMDNGWVSYTAGDTASETTDTFTYSMTDVHGNRSNIATVEIMIGGDDDFRNGPTLSAGELTPGSRSAIWLDHADDSAAVQFAWATTTGNKMTKCGEIGLGEDAEVLGIIHANQNGRAVLWFRVHPGWSGKTIFLQALDLNKQLLSNTLQVTIP